MPGQFWSKKNERQYQHITPQQVTSGTDEDRAEEIAASTVNTQQRREGRMRSAVSRRATGDRTPSLEDRPTIELYNRARELNIVGRSAMSKDELIRAIRSRQ